MTLAMVATEVLATEAPEGAATVDRMATMDRKQSVHREQPGEWVMRQVFPTDLAVVVDACPELSQHIRLTVKALVDSAKGAGRD